MPADEIVLNNEVKAQGMDSIMEGDEEEEEKADVVTFTLDTNGAANGKPDMTGNSIRVLMFKNKAIKISPFIQ